jgi:ferric-dicitrate binding protein FerR (iron transport regulator)
MRALVAIATLAVATPFVAAAAGEPNALRRDKGDVGYAVPAAAPTTQPLVGRIALPDDARAITGMHAAATLTLPDSSTVQIGDRTDVKIGAFRDGATQVVDLKRGALRFTINHPKGARASYLFRTPTCQIGVRGTLAYLVSGPNGDQVYCIDCAPGDVTVDAAGETYGVLSGQSLNVRRVLDRAFDATIVPNATINNPAIDQFLHGFSPFGRPAADNGADFTGSLSGT